METGDWNLLISIPDILVPMMQIAPFIHKFKSFNGNYYIYDVRTSRFVRVNQIVYDIVDDLGVLSIPEIFSKWHVKYEIDSIKKAVKLIEKHRKSALFSNKRFKKMIIPYDAQYLQEEVTSKIGYMVLNITEVCNMRCKYCSFSGTYRYERAHSNKRMDDRVLYQAIQYYLSHSKESRVRSISVYGGEPLTSFKKIIEIKNLVGNEIEVHIDSNGLLLERENVREAIIRNNFFLQISLDGPQLYHDRYRVDINGRPTFARITNNLRHIKKASTDFYRTHISFAVTMSPDTDLLELNDFFENEDLVQGNHIIVNSVNPYDTTFYDRFTSEDYSHQSAQYDALRRDYIRRRISGQEPTKFERALFEKPLVQLHLRKIDEPYEAMGMNGCCIPGLRKIFVNTDGRIYPCERVMMAYNIGNIDSGIEIDKIMNIAKEYIMYSEDDCINCWAAKGCGACFSTAVKNNRFDIERKRERCAVLKESRHIDFVTYATIMEENSNAFDFTNGMEFA
ncbi:MAG: radical SAM protein [candidate division WOR-3 bacterium]